MSLGRPDLGRDTDECLIAYSEGWNGFWRRLRCKILRSLRLCYNFDENCEKVFLMVLGRMYVISWGARRSFEIGALKYWSFLRYYDTAIYSLQFVFVGCPNVVIYIGTLSFELSWTSGIVSSMSVKHLYFLFSQLVKLRRRDCAVLLDFWGILLYRRTSPDLGETLCRSNLVDRDIDELSLDSVFICLVNDGHTCNLTADGGKKTGAFSLYATESFLLDPLHWFPWYTRSSGCAKVMDLLLRIEKVNILAMESKIRKPWDDMVGDSYI